MPASGFVFDPCSKTRNSFVCAHEISYDIYTLYAHIRLSSIWQKHQLLHDHKRNQNLALEQKIDVLSVVVVVDICAILVSAVFVSVN